MSSIVTEVLVLVLAILFTAVLVLVSTILHWQSIVIGIDNTF